MKKRVAMLTLILASTAQAGVLTVEDQNRNTGNCIPFGCAGSYGPFMTSIYRDIDPFAINAGDTIAFDLAGTNDRDIVFDIYLATAATNGGAQANADGFSKVVSGWNGGRGTAIQGDYELVFQFDTHWDFAGGGLLIAFSPVGATALDTSWSTGFYGNDLAGGTHVGQFYSGAAPGAGTYRARIIPNFQLTTHAQHTVPEPASLALIGLGLTGLMVARRKKSS